ncbi:hypothetical protein M422DRAFT_269123 [Sphaerobolus stellatus SS14]|uniref:Unplaced genomic scaffold SPHSTscaffold_207, whole genome shotgun sequence n=1 Tax=Sphaerobolus stellatus (strain SS14) TaxID=990650 RepID=A0A0C9UWG0_SPHS4|nr:hypothetical protein M422DRAFT_269123 [Sphaerobolus stellatus SS14]
MAASPRKSPRKKRTTKQQSKVHTSPIKQVQTQVKTKAKQQGGKKKQGDATSTTKGSKQGVKTREVTVPQVVFYHHYTDALLTLIEDNEQYKLAFGFEKGTSVSVTSGGKKPIDICRTLAQKVLLVDKETTWASKTPVELGEAVKNRVYNLRGLYNKNRALLSETGQGLLDEGREDEIAEGAPLRNVWDKIKRDFLWYMRMHALMGTGPVADRSAVGNSGTGLDLGVLGVRSGGGKASDEGMDESDEDAVNDPGSETWDIEKDSPMKDASGETLQPLANSSDDGEAESHGGSPGLDDDGVASPTPSPVKKKTIAAAPAPQSANVASGTSTPSAAPVKRPKGLFGELEAQIIAQHQANLEINKSNNQARIEVEKVRQHGKLKVQRMRLEAAKEEREAKMAHERELMQMQLEFQQRVGSPQSQHAHVSSPLTFPSGMSTGASSGNLGFDFSTYGSDSGAGSLSFDFTAASFDN